MFGSEGSIRIVAAVVGFVFGALTGWFVAGTGQDRVMEPTMEAMLIPTEECPSYELRRLNALLRDREKRPEEDVAMLRQRRDQIAEQICPASERP